ncbi:arylsulfatase : Arylsulfatase OS=Blastopirellula marina DSM 3645 GN=DSM3645_19478 PE=4 SV=1: Sulfatase [Gemmataceae bacterium]|nr:arylsulfatase : Arylsulfatase OS=Blastopirellula marina DSM 3645 GN=DSM3645_19478 PE=4 SV=1: Sulfatase [Gemmataceae bacterium]VTU02015.1 arylsulfatase : Arylsulfatase OS=Blastopirellula marina DSM 3645 GN=DSM3645_19478 PE=4 SV=1: Sulfatase [Gemmataceae bacterium]
MLRTLSALLLLALCSPPARAADAERPPNVVFILADDLGCFELGCYGQKLIKTPNIDKLAEGGMRFTHFYSGCPVCAPSRCALMTGKHMGHATIRDNKATPPEGQHPIRAEDVTVTELLKAKGYATGAMGKWGLGMWDTTGSPLKHGFDLFYGYNCQSHAHTHYPKYLYRNDTRIDLKDNDGKTGTQFTQDLFEAEALAFLDKNKATPFFLYLPFTVPHVAVQVPEDALAEYKGKLGDDPAYDGKKGYQPHPAPHAGYAAMVTRMDRTVGRVVEKLKELKLDGNTLVIFTSDNGPTHNVGGADSDFFKSAGTLRGLKGSVYEGGIRVPFIASWPGKIKPGTVSDERFYFPDVLPTLCEITGAKPPAGIDGVSFWPTLSGTGKQAPHEFLYWEFPGYGGQQAVIAGNWKAVRQALGKGVVRTELYDLAKDESETTDVADKNPEVLARLEKIMKEQHAPSAVFPLQTIDGPPKKK